MKTAEEFLNESAFDAIETFCSDVQRVVTVEDANKYASLVSEEKDRRIRELEEALEETIETVHELFSQGCYQHVRADGSGQYDHMCISAYESAQAFLIEQKRIKPEDCYRP